MRRVRLLLMRLSVLIMVTRKLTILVINLSVLMCRRSVWCGRLTIRVRLVGVWKLSSSCLTYRTLLRVCRCRLLRARVVKARNRGLVKIFLWCVRVGTLTNRSRRRLIRRLMCGTCRRVNARLTEGLSCGPCRLLSAMCSWRGRGLRIMSVGPTCGRRSGPLNCLLLLN